jgi:hypothetical protein
VIFGLGAKPYCGDGKVDALFGEVGACKESDCQFNDAIECSASAIKVAGHGGHADGSTYKPR